MTTLLDRISIYYLIIAFLLSLYVLGTGTMRRLDQDITVRDLATMTNQYSTYGLGKFHVDYMTGRINVHCWADHSLYGGKMVRDWPEDKFLTDQGIQACLEVIQRTVNRAFP